MPMLWRIREYRLKRLRKGACAPGRLDTAWVLEACRVGYSGVPKPWQGVKYFLLEKDAQAALGRLAPLIPALAGEPSGASTNAQGHAVEEVQRGKR